MMLKILLKRQMTEIFRNYVYDAKKNKKRSKAATISFIVLYVFTMVGVLGGMFAALSMAICGPLCGFGLGWLYFALLGLLSVLLGAFGSVFNTFSGLYLPKDNDLLLSMPIPVRYIMVSRLLGVYLMGLMYSGVVSVPAVVVYIVTQGADVQRIVGGLLFVLLTSVIVMILSCLLGYVVARISQKLKNKSFITVLISLVFIVVYYLFYFRAQEMLTSFLANAEVWGEKIRGFAYPVYALGRMGEGSVLAMLGCTCVVVLLFVLTMYIISKSFIKIATSTTDSGSTVKSRSVSKAGTLRGALFRKELGRFISSPNYMLNCGLGTLFLPLSGIVIAVKARTINEVLSEMDISEGMLAAFFAAAVCLMLSMNDMTAPSVSLEGKSLWIVGSLPVRARDVLMAKLQLQLVVTAPSLLIADICGIVGLRTSAAESVMILLVTFIFMLFQALFGLFLGLKMPNLSWTSEIAPIKQSGSVTITLLGGMAIAAVTCGVYFVIGDITGGMLYLAIVSVVFAAADIILYRWIVSRGAKIFSEL